VTHSFTPAFARDLLDADAVEIAARLHAHGFTTYFVGGCVRDLLLGRRPKDFDIGTSAKPEELKQIFGRRCRIIGRRFRLAHIYAGSQCFEVATFRGLPDDQETADDDSGFVVRANTFGTPEQDARSRDFTVNGLFYDPVHHIVIDHVDGTTDVDARLLRSIGPADKRLREDPVRLLRAVKFASRLGLSMHPDIVASAPIAAPLIATCPTARVSEELFRLAESGHAIESIDWLEKLGALSHLLPEVARYLEGDPAHRTFILDWLGEIDRLQRIHGMFPREATFSLFVFPFIHVDLMQRGDVRDLPWGRWALAHVRTPTLRLALPIRHRQALAGMFDVLKRMHFFPTRAPSTHHVRHFGVPLALTVLRTRWRMGDDAVAGPYELWAAAADKIGVWGAPFEPRANEGDEEGSENSRPHGAEPRTRGEARPRPVPAEAATHVELKAPATAQPARPKRAKAAPKASAPATPPAPDVAPPPAEGDAPARRKRRRRRSKGPGSAAAAPAE
jgi:poly(A) polymerase